MEWSRRCLLILVLVGATQGTSASALEWSGISLAGAEFGDYALPGTYGYHYTYPSAAEVDYFLAKGVNLFRIPFRWERLQPTLEAPLDAAELARLAGIVDYATSLGAQAILDPHNYARYQGEVIGSAALPNEAFADFWSRLATQFANRPRVILGLMTEPHDMPTEQWLSAANSAIAAIRQTGANNLILVPGAGWDGASSWSSDWYGTPNAEVMLGVVDPSDQYAFEVHQYLDVDASGTTPGIVHASVGSERLAGFTQWLVEHDQRGFLGEFAVARETIGDEPAQIGDEALSDLLDHLEANSEVWLGWAWWAGGPWWGDYMFTLDPEQLGEPGQRDRPQMGVLEPHLLPEPGAAFPVGVIWLAWLASRRRSAARPLRRRNAASASPRRRGLPVAPRTSRR